MNQEQIDISFVVIGRNEAENLPHIAKQLAGLKISKKIELIYIDSSSTDVSVSIAKQYFDIVVLLEESPNLSASAGRFVGTKYATGEWILYIDGDMRLHPDFILFLDRAPLTQIQHGIVGPHLIVDSFNELVLMQTESSKQAVTKVHDGFSLAKKIAGTLLVRREHILHCGNWNPGLYGNEEGELLSRFRMFGITMCHVDVPMVVYEKNSVPLLPAALGYFTPFGHRGKMFYGFGQVLRSLNSIEHAKNYFSVNPYPFLYFLAIIALMLSLKWGLILYLILPALIALMCCIIKNKGKRFLVSYLGFPIRAVLGWIVYDEKFRPVVTTALMK